MKTFKQLLIEVKRDRARIHKLINYIADKAGGDDNEIHFKREWHYFEPDPSFKGDKHKFTYLGKKTMKMSDLHPGQGTFSKAGLDYYNDKFNDEFRNPIKAVYYPHLDKHVIHDGHHRWLSNKLKGRTEDDVHVWTPNEHWKDDSKDD